MVNCANGKHAIHFFTRILFNGIPTHKMKFKFLQIVYLNIIQKLFSYGDR